MKLATVVQRPDSPTSWQLMLLDAQDGEVLLSHDVGDHPAVDFFPEIDRYVVLGRAEEGGHQVDFYRISDGHRSATTPIAWHIQYNAFQLWPAFVLAPDRRWLYVYRPVTVGDHRSDDFIRGIDLHSHEFGAWEVPIPECIMGWCRSGSGAHAQMLFVSDGLDRGELPLPSEPRPQKLALWRGPGAPLDTIVLGQRPVAHSDLGHARATVYAPQSRRAIVVCTDGAVIVVDPSSTAIVSRQQVAMPTGAGMPIFAARVDESGRWLFVGAAGAVARAYAASECVLIHDLEREQTVAALPCDGALSHWAIDPEGSRLFGAVRGRDEIVVLDTHTGDVVLRKTLPGASTAVYCV